MSKNIFTVKGNTVTIEHPSWGFKATATIKPEYIKELKSVTWSHNRYIRNKKLGSLHSYVMKQWYGEGIYEKMKAEGFVIDHMDNVSYNCELSNLCYLSDGENKAKGFTVDKYAKEKTYIALSMFKDFETELIQITIAFNYPARAICKDLSEPAVIEMAYLLYESDYEIVINDARTILLQYKRDYSFNPDKLNFEDYHIEGCYGTAWPVERYEEYINGGHGHAVMHFMRRAPIKNWNLETKEYYFTLRGNPFETV